MGLATYWYTSLVKDKLDNLQGDFDIPDTLDGSLFGKLAYGFQGKGNSRNSHHD